ncbi:hypothetical protein [Streptosporangium roseum]|uniref:hypothetical protein n=1 Tax=Streptosporangium roseum TaxID=2001 RepID=UPI0001A3E02E|nr:hypothetical protein [Streptosporangium roseum]
MRPAALDAELPFPLSELLAALSEALRRRPFRQRIADAALTLGDESLMPFREARAGRAD